MLLLTHEHAQGKRAPDLLSTARWDSTNTTQAIPEQSQEYRELPGVTLRKYVREAIQAMAQRTPLLS